MSTKKAEARERIKAMREEQARRDRRRERTMRFGVAGAVVAAVAIIAIAVAASRGGGGPVQIPAAAGTANGLQIDGDGTGILVGDEAASVTIDYWMDFLCPHCEEFEQANASTIDELVEAGDANIVYHPLDFTGGVYSRRANNAFGCAADEGNAAEFVDAAFAAQQQWSTSTLVDLGEQSGIGGGYADCVRDDTFEDWAAAVPPTAQDHQVSGTPTVYLNGELLDSTQWTPEGLRAAVETVAAGGSLATPPAEGGTAPAPPATPAPSATP